MFFLLPENATRPSLLVQVSKSVAGHEEAELRAQMYGLSCPSGMLIDPERCLIFRDEYRSTGPESIVVVGELDSQRLLAAIPPGGHVQRVERWLNLLASQWDLAVPQGSESAALLISDIVPAAIGAEVRISASEAAE